MAASCEDQASAVKRGGGSRRFLFDEVCRELLVSISCKVRSASDTSLAFAETWNEMAVVSRRADFRRAAIVLVTFPRRWRSYGW